MPNITKLVDRVEREVMKALTPSYTLDVEIRPDQSNAVREVVMYDDDGNKRMHIGKRNNDYGIWISRRGFPLTDDLNDKYLSFTGSKLTPRLKYSGELEMVFTGDEFNYDFATTLIVPREFPDETITIVGFFKVIEVGGAITRTPYVKPYLIQDMLSFTTVTDTQYEFYIDRRPVYYDLANLQYMARTIEGMYLEYFVFSDK